MATPAALVAVVVNVDHTAVVEARRCNCTERTTPTPPVVIVTACDTGKPTAAVNADELHPDTTVADTACAGGAMGPMSANTASSAIRMRRDMEPPLQPGGQPRTRALRV